MNDVVERMRMWADDHYTHGDQVTEVTVKDLHALLHECDKARAQRDALAKAGDNLLWLHRLKRKINTGTATDKLVKEYPTREAFGYLAMEKALAVLDERNVI